MEAVTVAEETGQPARWVTGMHLWTVITHAGVNSSDAPVFESPGLL